MKEKYYTPEIEEFYVGFEYEYKNSTTGDWQKEIFNRGIGFAPNPTVKDCRVKYLDRDDIESLGFFVATTSGMEAAYGKRDDKNELRFILREKYHNNTIQIERVLYYNAGKTTLFEGKIKNKSELKKLLKQLGI
jgi:hypothetical protein